MNFSGGKWVDELVAPANGELTIRLSFETPLQPKEIAGNVTLIKASPGMYKALQVLSLDPKISAWLEENDPMALKQVRCAINDAEGQPASQ